MDDPFNAAASVVCPFQLENYLYSSLVPLKGSANKSFFFKSTLLLLIQYLFLFWQILLFSAL